MFRSVTSLCIAVAATLVVGNASFAQEFYVGTLVEPTEKETTPDTQEYRGFIGLAGVRVPMNNTFFLAGETEISIDRKTGAGVDDDSPDRLHRYRAHLGANLSNLSIFFGTTTRELTASNHDDAFETLYLNFGVDVSLSDNVSIRFEAIQDSLTPGEGPPENGEDRLRLGTLINF